LPEISLRPAASDDAAAILDIYAPVVRDTAASFEVKPPSVTDMQARVQTILADYPWLVAERDGRILGYAYASRHRPRPAYQWVVETSIYVHPDARRQGLAARLYTALFDILQLQGLYKAYAVITLPGLSSVGLHESLGFRQFAVYKAVGFKLVDQLGGEADAVAWMEQQRNVPKNLKIVDWKPKKESDWGVGRLSLAAVVALLGASAADTVAEVLQRQPILARLRLDGLVSVWQGSER